MPELDEIERPASLLVPAPKVKRTPSDLLPERRAYMRHFSQGEAPTITELVIHAERYGSECVLETAAELGYGADALIRLADRCDAADLTLLRKSRPSARLEKRVSSEERARLLLGLEKDEEA